MVICPFEVIFASCYANIPSEAELVLPHSPASPYQPITNENAAYSVYATAHDLYTFFCAMFRDDALISKMTSLRIAVCDGVQWCRGFGLIDERYAFQYGDNGDFQALFFADIAEHSVSLRFGNDCYGLMDAVNAVQNDALKNRLTEFLRKEYGADYGGLLRPQE